MTTPTTCACALVHGAVRPWQPAVMRASGAPVALRRIG
jgi:hypothetical protein